MEFDETTYDTAHATENAAQTAQTYEGAIDRVQPTGTMVGFHGGPFITAEGGYGVAVNDPLSTMFVNTALASRALWLVASRMFGRG
jgi:hypothetical protein